MQIKENKFKVFFETLLSFYFLMIFVVSFSYMFFEYVETFFRVFFFQEYYTLIKNDIFFKTALAFGWIIYVFVLWYFFHIVSILFINTKIKESIKLKYKLFPSFKSFGVTLNNIFFMKN